MAESKLTDLIPVQKPQVSSILDSIPIEGQAITNINTEALNNDMVTTDYEAISVDDLWIQSGYKIASLTGDKPPQNREEFEGMARAYFNIPMQTVSGSTTTSGWGLYYDRERFDQELEKSPGEVDYRKVHKLLSNTIISNKRSKDWQAFEKYKRLDKAIKEGKELDQEELSYYQSINPNTKSIPTWGAYYDRERVFENEETEKRVKKNTDEILSDAFKDARLAQLQVGETILNQDEKQLAVQVMFNGADSLSREDFEEKIPANKRQAWMLYLGALNEQQDLPIFQEAVKRFTGAGQRTYNNFAQGMTNFISDSIFATTDPRHVYAVTKNMTRQEAINWAANQAYNPPSFQRGSVEQYQALVAEARSEANSKALDWIQDWEYMKEIGKESYDSKVYQMQLEELTAERFAKGSLPREMLMGSIELTPDIAGFAMSSVGGPLGWGIYSASHLTGQYEELVYNNGANPETARTLLTYAYLPYVAAEKVGMSRLFKAFKPNAKLMMDANTKLAEKVLKVSANVAKESPKVVATETVTETFQGLTEGTIREYAREWGEAQGIPEDIIVSSGYESFIQTLKAMPLIAITGSAIGSTRSAMSSDFYGYDERQRMLADADTAPKVEVTSEQALNQADKATTRMFLEELRKAETEEDIATTLLNYNQNMSLEDAQELANLYQEEQANIAGIRESAENLRRTIGEDPLDFIDRFESTTLSENVTIEKTGKSNWIIKNDITDTEIPVNYLPQLSAEAIYGPEGVYKSDAIKQGLQEATAFWDGDTGMIWLSDRATEGSLQHELIHAYTKLGVLTDKETKTLIDASKNYLSESELENINQAYKKDLERFGKKRAKEILEEEYVAHMFEKMQNNGIPKELQNNTILDKIKAFIQKLLGMVNRNQLIEDVMSGKPLTIDTVVKFNRQQELFADPDQELMTEQDFEELGIDFSDEGMLADLRQETEAEAPTEVDEDVVSGF